MAFTLPTFNVVCNVWTNALITNPPTFSVTVNLTPGRRGFFVEPLITNSGALNAVAGWGNMMEILAPKLTDLRGPQNNGVTQVVECPAGSARYYYVCWVDDIGKGFANEHRLALVRQCDFLFVSLLTIVGTFGPIPPWPVPTP
jgi:hypothetical protein